MSIHFDPRSSGVGQPGTAVIKPSGSTLTPNRQRKPRWVAPLGLVIGAITVVGVGMLVLDTSSETPQPSPTPTLEFTESGTSQRLIQESIDAALEEKAAVTVGSEEGLARRLVQESIDAAMAENGN